MDCLQSWRRLQRATSDRETVRLAGGPATARVSSGQIDLMCSQVDENRSDDQA